MQMRSVRGCVGQLKAQEWQAKGMSVHEGSTWHARDIAAPGHAHRWRGAELEEGERWRLLLGRQRQVAHVCQCPVGGLTNIYCPCHHLVQGGPHLSPLDNLQGAAQQKGFNCSA